PDEVLSKCYLEKKIKNWSGYLAEGSTDEMLQEIRKRELTGRPLGDESFIEKIERLLGRQLMPKKTGPGKNK
ncbi:MAG: transposase, partial [Candidatus Omnitrophica bacterium]|nr:transposase [Candidatus Omnitrophota bacterium]